MSTLLLRAPSNALAFAAAAETLAVQLDEDSLLVIANAPAPVVCGVSGAVEVLEQPSESFVFTERV